MVLYGSVDRSEIPTAALSNESVVSIVRCNQNSEIQDGSY